MHNLVPRPFEKTDLGMRLLVCNAAHTNHVAPFPGPEHKYMPTQLQCSRSGAEEPGNKVTNHGFVDSELVLYHYRC